MLKNLTALFASLLIAVSAHAASPEEVKEALELMRDKDTPGITFLPGHNEYFTRTQLVFVYEKWKYHINFWKPEKDAAPGSDQPFFSIWRKHLFSSVEQVEHIIDYDLTGAPSICMIPADTGSTATTDARCDEAYDRALKAVLAYIAKAKTPK